LRMWAFPLGLPYRAPNDRLADAVADIILQPNEARDRLTQGLFVPTDMSEPLGRLEDALLRTLAAEPILARIRGAMRDKHIAAGDPELRITAAVEAGIISSEDAIIVHGAIAARRQVIDVDDFAPEQLNPQFKIQPNTQPNSGTPQWNSDPQHTASAVRST